MLQVQDLTVRYGPVSAVRGISFDVQPGQMVALVGPSGAGKTTITSLVSRLYDVQSGSVRVGGHDVRTQCVDQLADDVGWDRRHRHTRW